MSQPETITAILPYPPSANRYWRRAGRVIYKSKEGADYAKQVKAMFSIHGITPHDHPVSVAIDLFRPKKAGDLDNRIKVLLDSLNGIVFNDDSQVVDIHARRFDRKGWGGVIVRIKPVGELPTLIEMDKLPALSPVDAGGRD